MVENKENDADSLTNPVSLTSRSSESRLTTEDLATLLSSGSGMEEESPSVTSPEASEVSKSSLSSEDNLLPTNTGLLVGLPVKVMVFLGEKFISINELQNLQTGDIIEMDTKVGDAIDIYVSNKLYAEGKLIAIDNLYLGIQIINIYGLSDIN